ncbi:MAG: putative metal-binding motif-containing protein [Alphaproteobacteria bacterium]|nr:putative metal-binding motif-containing protein [Alphaproteobacteria bacterium]
MRRSFALWVPMMGLLPLAWAATGGPDNGDVVFIDSDEADGPPHVVLDIDDEGTDLGLGNDGTETVTLPFSVSWYGSIETTLVIGDNGTAFFQGDQSASQATCPAGGSWAGVAAYWDELAAGSVKVATLGQYPYRLYVIDWQDIVPGTASGDGHVQAWFQEARDDVVLVLDDVTFGSSSYDGGNGAVIGVQGSATAGLAWSCAGGLSDGTSASFGPATGQPGSAEQRLADVSLYWYGSDDFDYLGQTLASGDLNGDGLSDLLMGAPEADTVWLVYGGASPGVGDVVGASTSFLGASGDELGSALAIADLDGDGLSEVILGESGGDQAGSNAGAVFLFANMSFGGAITARTDADATLTWGSVGAEGGSTLASNGDVDGDGYNDLAIGAIDDDTAATNAGAVALYQGGATLSGGSLYGAPTFEGEAGGDRLGVSLAMGDADADGLADLLLGSAQNDDTATDAGKVYLVPGGSWSGITDAATASTATFTGGASLDYFGSALALGDLDGDGLGDLVVGARREDSGATNAGAVFLFLDGGSWSGAYGAADADLQITGDNNNQQVGQTLALGDLDGDGEDDLAIGGPGANASSGGVWIFTGLPSGSTATIADADFALSGAASAGAAGTAIAVMEDHNADGLGDVAVGAFFASAASGTLNGLVTIWSYAPSFLDADGDGLLARSASGPDCDDDDAASFPGAEEDTALDTGDWADDNDCDGWVDGAYAPRLSETLWEYDLDAVLGGPGAETFGFESATASSSVAGLYYPNGMRLAASGSVTAAADIYGATPAGSLGAKVSAGSANRVELLFTDDVDAVAFQLMDASDPLSVRAWDSDGVELLATSGRLRVEHEGEDIPGGRFVGITFSRSVREVRLDVRTSDGWGLDDIQVVWAEESDRDGDGWTGADGDCDDGDAAVNPGAAEDLTNNVDDDCDGVIDGGGATAYTSATDWEADAGIDVETVDFEDPAVNTTVTTEYADVGVEVDGTLQVVTDVDGAAPADSQAGEAIATTVTITFDEVQPAVAFQLLDGNGTFTVYGWAHGRQLYGNTISASGDDVAGGVFHGYVYDYGVDTLEITGPGADTWGLDDLRLSVLGLDDADGDGYTEAQGDCDDDDASANPDASETWYDGVDSDCDGGSDYDSDGDGYDLGLDCDDGDASTNPDASETWYDGVDTDCDGGSDYDADGDGYDSAINGGTDCDDADASVSPNAPETYYDGVDDNCDPTDDNDADGDGYSSTGYPTGALGSGDCDDASASTNPDASETWYDGVDSDCAEDSDYDSDGDGYDSDSYGGDDCNDRSADVHPGAADTWYDGIDSDCAGDSDYDADLDTYDSDLYGGTDCDDTDAAINPSATESSASDGVDEDCDGTDEWDYDGDGHRDVNLGGDDCDDSDPSVNPSASEVCYDGTDQDCDGTSDEYDCDGDGYDSDAYGGTDCDDTNRTVYPGATEYVYDGVDSDCDGTDDYDFDGDGYQVDWYGGSDCDDTDPSIYPGATEIWYDGVDQDCDGGSDYDADGDGADSDLYLGDDCDDADSAIGPHAEDVPYDGIDQNCDGADAVDLDGDGYGAASAGGSDCDDTDATIHPAAAEVWYDGVDQDCDGASDYDADADEQDSDAYGGDDCDDTDPTVYRGAPEVWYNGDDDDCLGGDDYDQDGDGHRVIAWGGDDCNDVNADTHPGVEVDDCGGGDNDCDGRSDEDCVSTDDTGNADDTGVTDDTGASDDTGAADDSAADDSATDDSAADDSAITADDTGDGGVDDDTGVTGGRLPGTDKGRGCGCAGSGQPSGLGLALLALLLVRRRRDQGMT